VLAAIGDEMLLDFGPDEPIALRCEASRRSRPAAPRPAGSGRGRPRDAPGEAVLATWRQLLDDGSMQAGEPYMAATARPAVIRIGPANAATSGSPTGTRSPSPANHRLGDSAGTDHRHAIGIVWAP
jgi:NADH-quinone oxidoreductase subunit G